MPANAHADVGIDVNHQSATTTAAVGVMQRDAVRFRTAAEQLHQRTDAAASAAHELLDRRRPAAVDDAGECADGGAPAGAQHIPPGRPAGAVSGNSGGSAAVTLPAVQHQPTVTAIPAATSPHHHCESAACNRPEARDATATSAAPAGAHAACEAAGVVFSGKLPATVSDHAVNGLRDARCVSIAAGFHQRKAQSLGAKLCKRSPAATHCGHAGDKHATHQSHAHHRWAGGRQGGHVAADHHQRRRCHHRDTAAAAADTTAVQPATDASDTAEDARPAGTHAHAEGGTAADGAAAAAAPEAAGGACTAAAHSKEGAAGAGAAAQYEDTLEAGERSLSCYYSGPQ